jgi:hypothetical protein
MCNPIPADAPRYDLCQGLHQTSGLEGNWTIDLCVAPKTLVLACEAGTVTRLSGHPPSEDTWDAAGTFSWTVAAGVVEAFDVPEDPDPRLFAGRESFAEGRVSGLGFTHPAGLKGVPRGAPSVVLGAALPHVPPLSAIVP